MYVCEQAPSPKTLCKCLVYGVFVYVRLCIATSVISMSCVCGLIGNWFMIIWDYIVGSFYGHILLYLPVAWCCLGTRSSASTAMVLVRSRGLGIDIGRIDMGGCRM